MAITKTRRIIITGLALLFAVTVLAPWVGRLSSASWATVAAAPASAANAGHGPGNTVWG
jgi:hypothetical protein